MNSLVDLPDDDARAVCDAVEHYVRLELAPRCTRSETPIPDAACRSLVDGLADLGVLSQGSDTGWGIWDNDRVPANRCVSIRNLQCLGRYSAAVAYQVHLQAMAAYLDRLAGVGGARGLPLAVLQGHLGMGRDALVRSLCGAALTREQQTILGDNWGWPTGDKPRWLHALRDWTAVWVPTWDVDAGWSWRRVEREMINAPLHPHSLGLDELTTHAIAATRHEVRSQPTAILTGRTAGDALTALLAMHAAALLALSQAVVEVAWARAHQYAQTRYQGGQLIAGYPAVQHLLSRALGAAQEASRVLTHLESAESRWPDLRSLWRDRARCQISLSAGASAALQVFGGMGYMQDNAMEKLLRQANHLRLLGGSPAELSLCVAHWDALLGDPADVIRYDAP